MFLERLATLGSWTAEMHSVLASQPRGPTFTPEEQSYEALSLLTATSDEEIKLTFVRCPGEERGAEIAGRGQCVRARLAMRAQLGICGRVIRTHGDHHHGQTRNTSTGCS